MADNALVPVAAPVEDNWYYDLSPVTADFLDDSRFFQWDVPADNPNACPERGGKQVSAVAVPAKGAYPKEILDLAARLAQK